VFAAPFTGSTTAGNNENGRNGYLKTLSVRVPMRGADVSKDVIEPLVKDPNGFVVIVEKRDKVGDGSYEVIGYQNALRGDIAGVTRDESANGGDWIVPLTTIEKWAEVDLVGAAETYESAKKEFEGLFGFELQETRFVFVDGQNQLQLTANGLAIIEHVQDGVKIRNTYSALSDTTVTINADADTEVVIYGKVTRFSIYPPYPHNVLKSLDVSKNAALTDLNCSGCTGLTSLDVSKNAALTDLNCGDCTGLTSLDVSKNAALTDLNCSGCTRLTSLGVSKNSALVNLNCSGCTRLTSLDVSKNVVLEELYCSDCTGLTLLDVSKNVALTDLNCSGCTGLTSLDVSKNVALTYFDCGDCTGLMLLDIQNTALLNDGVLANSTMTALTTIQLNGTNEWAQLQIGGWLEQYAPTGGKLYANQATLQDVLVSAENKAWEVIYVS
jgi:hypothetical protein